jgi:hypothetical protein
VRGSTAYELEGEKIRRSSNYYDHATIMCQVGALLLEAPWKRRRNLRR